MAKLAIKSDNITPFGGLYSVFNRFSASGLRETIDSHLGKRSSDPKAFTYGDVFGSLFGNYLCGGDCIEDVMDIKPFWDGHENIRIASSDTIERTLRSLAEDNISYESDSNGNYAFNTCDKMNRLLLKCLKVTGQLNPGDCVDLDFDHQFIAADKKDAKYSYKKSNGYFPGIASVGGLIVGVENRDANTNVKFHQKDTLERIITRIEKQSKVIIRNFRADCGSFSSSILEYVKDHCEHFYIRANNCGSRRTEFMEHTDWTEVTIGGKSCGVATFPFTSFMKDEGFRLVVQRSSVSDEDPRQESEGIFGTEYVYRCIITNDWNNSEKAIITYYNQRGASERNFDCQNNDFGWAHLPFSYLNENAVFLLVTAILKNFYVYILETIGNRVKGLDVKCRLKRFIRKFMSVPAKWIRSSRQNILNLYTRQQIYLEL